MTDQPTPRRRIVVEGYDQLVTRAVELVGTVPGARSFELRYDAADRVLAEDEEPRPDEAVAWTAEAELRRRYARGTKPVVRTITGTAIAPPGGRHDVAIVDAVVELLRKLGANVELLIGPAE